MAEQFTLEFTLPEGKELHSDESEPLLAWIADTVAYSQLQGITVRLFVNGVEEPVVVRFEQGKQGGRLPS